MDFDYIKQGDCLELMKEIPDGSVDMILCDPPYGTTRNEWDSVINLDSLWIQYRRIIKPNGAILLFSQMPFSAELALSNPKWFRYEWIWKKNIATGFLNSHRMLLKCHENILVFYKSLPIYNPQFKPGKPYRTLRRAGGCSYGIQRDHVTENPGVKYPIDFLKYETERGFHPTQKPVALLEYLIKTYTNEGDIVLDNCMGSGSTCVAAVNTGRHYIGFELDPQYFEIARQRLDEDALTVPVRKRTRGFRSSTSCNAKMDEEE